MCFTKVNMMLLDIGKGHLHLSYSKKVDLIKNVFVSEKNFCFPQTTRSFKYEWLLLLPWHCSSSRENAYYSLSCFLLGHDFPTKVSQVYFYNPSGIGQILFLTLELILKAKRRKLILHMNLFKAFIFHHVLNLKLFFFLN